MFAHKEVSHKVRGPTRSESAQHLSVWFYRERFVHILYAFWAYYTQSVLTLHRESFSSSAITPRRVLISQKVAHACYLRSNEKKRSPSFNSGVSLESPRKYDPTVQSSVTYRKKSTGNQLTLNNLSHAPLLFPTEKIHWNGTLDKIWNSMNKTES